MDTEKEKKLIIGISASAGAFLIIAGTITAYILSRPVKIPDAQKDPDGARKLLSSKDFQKLTPQQQNDFVRSMRPRRRPTREEMEKNRKAMENMSPEERRIMQANMRKVFMRQEEERLNKFFKMSKAEQLAELDRRIAERDRMRERMRQNRQRNANPRQNNIQRAGNNSNNTSAQQPQNGSPNNSQQTNNEQNNNRRRRPSAQMRREFEASISPATRAKMQQYWQMERLRREGKLK
jgi:hypothetical protein